MLKPLGSRLLVQPIKSSATVTTATGLMYEDTEFKAPQSLRAKVLAIGPDVTGITVGSEIFCSQFAPTQALEKPGDKTVIVPEEDVLCVVVPDTDEA